MTTLHPPVRRSYRTGLMVPFCKKGDPEQKHMRLLFKPDPLKKKPHSVEVRGNIRPIILGDLRIATFLNGKCGCLKRYAATSTAHIAA